jgi:2-dehydro-3-deoxyphosphogluconate aldolase/(4S)-4-hydroxy-2-oxoglutarate aldolase
MPEASIFESVSKHGIVPVIAIDSAEAALPLADALIAGGLPIVEITFRTAAAAEAIRRISSQRPEVLVGAGTVLTQDNLEAARQCGARFGVAPGLNPQIVGRAQELGLPFVPGVATPSEIELALSLGCKVLKFFPAEALGGLPMLSALSAPYGHTGVRFLPTGGVSEKNLEAYASTSSVAAVGGTWIAKKEDIAAGKWGEIADRCKRAAEIVRSARSGKK